MKVVCRFYTADGCEVIFLVRSECHLKTHHKKRSKS